MHEVNGHNSFAVGAILGSLQQGQERLIFVAELHGQSIARLSEVQASMAAALSRIEAKPSLCAHLKTPSKEAMNWKDQLQLAVFVLAMLAVAAGKMQLADGLKLVGKPFGF